ncbi:hypothetical protein BHE74_00018338 [Ensete ventricosum]|nr:hypothetical protein BHE74_00018338 [Ensete ventricosum]
MILPLENQDLSLLDICPVGAIFLFAFFPLEVLKTTIPLDYSALLNKLCIVMPPQMHLLDCDSLPIQPSKAEQYAELVAHFNLLWIYPSHAKEKVPYSTAPSFDHIGMATNTLLSAYKPLHEYRILRVSNSSGSFAQIFWSLCNTSHFARSHLLVSALLALSTVKFSCQLSVEGGRKKKRENKKSEKKRRKGRTWRKKKRVFLS